MTIELANKLIKLRKEAGYTQDELAEKLDVSRQSISKWESGEATPSIDYVQKLAKIYGITVDELLDTENDVKPKGKKEKKNKGIHFDNGGIHIEDDETSVHIGKEGIFVNDADEKVEVSKNGIYVNDKEVDGSREIKIYHKGKLVEKILNSCAIFLIVAAYLCLGFLLERGWDLYWPILFFIPVPGMLFRTFRKRRFCEFPIVFLVCFAYFFCGMNYSLWHPLWILFLLIPLYYSVFGPVDSYLRSKKIRNEINDIKDDAIDVKVNIDDKKE